MEHLQSALDWAQLPSENLNIHNESQVTTQISEACKNL